MGVHRFGLLLSRYTTKAARAARRWAAVLAAAAVMAGGMWLTAPVASAGSPQCGSVCINLFNQKFGTTDVAAVPHGAVTAGHRVILAAALFAGPDSPAEDWTTSIQGRVSDFYAAGLMSAALNQHYGTDEAVEIAYTPGGTASHLCLGIASGPGQGTPVTLQPCGVTVGTVWIFDTADASGGYMPFISGQDTQYPAPYVLTANTAGDSLITQALKANTAAAAGAQRWKAALAGIPTGNYYFNGYTANGARATDVKADWTVPGLQNCSGPLSAEAPAWIGLGGINAPLVQIGTQTLCGYLGTSVATAVYEIVPKMSGPTPIAPLLPGDSVEAEVKYLTGNQYYLSITDKTLHWSWSQTVTQPDANPRPQTADWIVERTKDRPLAEFGTVEFTNCYWSDGTSTTLSPLTTGTVYDGTDPSGDLQTLISPIGSGGIGPGFTVTWLHS